MQRKLLYSEVGARRSVPVDRGRRRCAPQEICYRSLSICANNRPQTLKAQRSRCIGLQRKVMVVMMAVIGDDRVWVHKAKSALQGPQSTMPATKSAHQDSHRTALPRRFTARDARTQLSLETSTSSDS